MKNKILLFTIGAILLLFNCKEDLKGPLEKSNDIPSPPTNIKVENNAGSAIIRYDLPNEDDLLYVMAVFSSQEGNERIVKSSVFKNFISLEGFGDSKEYTVTLFSVNRSEKRSHPVTTIIKPLTARVKEVFQTLDVQTTFGGVNVKFSNEPEDEYIAYTLIKDSVTGKWIEYDRLYTKAKKLNYSIRGFESVPTDFAIYLTDKWKNNSDTLFTNLIPLYEVEFDKSLWKDAKLADDFNIPRYGALSQLWTPGATTYFFMKQDMPGLKLPNWFTIDLGRPYIFARLKVNGVDHHNNWKYSQGTPKNFEIWGSNLPSTNWNDWNRLGEFECIKPSGLPMGQFTAEDLAASTAGHDYDFDIQPTGYRYMRFKTLTTFGGNADVMLLELTLWGKPVN